MDHLGSMIRISGLLLVVIFTLFALFVIPTSSLKCYQCGQYTDGVGSITPCINYTERLHLKDCPLATSQQCIKYVSEGSTVRDCAPAECVERGEGWGTKVFCCSEDGCNAATTTQAGTVTSVVAATLVPAILHMVAN
uniref:UPAR/Ly6 domain-containing protein n=1 Tax=Cuerna arida TaxID=1464854 RepID=A0A1B6GD31_9HEMI